MATLSFEDYSLYSNLSDDELLQLAIERSLNEPSQSEAPLLQQTPPPRENQPDRAPFNTQYQNASAARRNSSSQNPPVYAHYSSPNPPNEKPPDPKTFNGTISRFMTGSGKRMVTYRRLDESIAYIGPEPEDEEEPIFKAIRVGNTARVKALALTPGTNLMLPSKPGWLAIHQAVWYNKSDCLKALISVQPGMLNKRADRGETPLLVAAQRDSLDCAIVLLENGADPDTKNYDKETPLYKACELSNAALVAALLNHGAELNVPCIQGWTALQEAVVRNNVEICQMLVTAGAKINIPNEYGITPLFTAAQTGSMATLRFLIKQGADINTQAADGNTALYEAAKNRHEEVVELLLSLNADANRPGRNGLMPLHVAAQNGDETIVSMLIPKTSKPRVNRCGISPLHMAAERNRDEVLEMLLDAGFNSNALLNEERSSRYEDRRRTALYFSVANVNLDMVSLLLNHGAATDLDTLPPLLVAARQGAVQTVTLLLEHGADVNITVPGLNTTFPPLLMFCTQDPPLLKLLLDHGLKALPCFTCSYGSKPHPPLRSQSEDRTRTMEFCEMVSSSTVSRWVGPIVDLLLDYVGHMTMCSRLIDHLDSYSEWSRIKEKGEPPRSLMHLCRLKICSLVPKRRLKRLPLPPRLLRFVQHRRQGDLDSEDLESQDYNRTHQILC
ncbi:ankyrin repeat and SOCS box protein 2-like [Eucyclogobius newberryi]|uniref:ankyrin repeat and SOCS box protein 2-like n=1 Tax=Eucyclogobius newberryi TaxID=166745 RepID=UPI003B58FFA1